MSPTLLELFVAILLILIACILGVRITPYVVRWVCSLLRRARNAESIEINEEKDNHD